MSCVFAGEEIEQVYKTRARYISARLIKTYFSKEKRRKGKKERKMKGSFFLSLLGVLGGAASMVHGESPSILKNEKKKKKFGLI